METTEHEYCVHISSMVNILPIRNGNKSATISGFACNTIVNILPIRNGNGIAAIARLERAAPVNILPIRNGNLYEKK